MSDPTCTHHNDQQREECPVCLVTQLRARAERAEAELKDARRVITEQLTLRLTAEENLDHLIVFDNGMHKRYEADLAAEREKAERYRLVTLRLDAELAKERKKMRCLRTACKYVAYHPRIKNALAKTEDAK